MHHVSTGQGSINAVILMVSIDIVKIEKTEDLQVMIGHASFIKTVEDLYEKIVETVPGIKFGLAFSEASGPCLVRTDGNDEELKKLAGKNMFDIGAGHTFIVLFKNAYPINIVNAVKGVSEVQRIYCATANQVEVVIAKGEHGNAILGIVDGYRPKGIEGEKDVKDRHDMLRKFGYKR